MAAKFGRTYHLFVDFLDSPIPPPGVPQAPSVPGTQIEITNPFTVEFDITRSILSSANTSNFRIYNLSESIRKQIYKDPFILDRYKGLEFKAGYDKITPTVFKGNVKEAWSVREGTNFITTIDCFDGGFAFVNGQTAKSFPSGTPNQVIIDTVLNNLPNVSRGTVAPFKGAISRGNTISGNSAELAKELSGGGFFVDLEKSYILGDNDCILGPVQTINSASGLLGTPKREGTLLTFDILFEPRLLIGQIIILQSLTAKNFNGQYKVMGVKHKGTISDAVAGTAVTTVTLWYGSQALRVIG